VAEAQTRAATQSERSQQESTIISQNGNQTQNRNEVRTTNTQLIPTQLRNSQAPRTDRESTPRATQEQQQQNAANTRPTQQQQQQHVDEQGNIFFTPVDPATAQQNESIREFQNTTGQANNDTGTNSHPANETEQPTTGVIGMQVSTPNRDNRRPAQEQTGGTPNSKRGRGTNNGAVTLSTPTIQATATTQAQDNNDSNLIDREQLSTQSNTSNEASINTAPEGRIVVTENGFTFVNRRNSPRRVHQSRPLEIGNGGRGGRGFGGGNLTGPERRYRRAIHPLVTGVLRSSRPASQQAGTSSNMESATTTPNPTSNNGVYQGGYYQALAEFDDEDEEIEAIPHEEENTIASEYDYTSQPGDTGRNDNTNSRTRRIPTSLQEALQLLSSYKLLPGPVDADPAGGHLHCD
jgi:hypothetical protein